MQDSTVTSDNGCYTDGFMKNRITASFIGKFRWVSEDKFVNPEDLYKTLTILPGEENTVVFDGMTFADPFEWVNASKYLLVKNEKFLIMEEMIVC